MQPAQVVWVMLRTVAMLVVVVGCVESKTIECANGETCPAGALCDDVNGGCIVREQQTACAGVVDETACTWESGAGACRNGVCLPHLCGDGRRSGSERCDPTDSDVTDRETTCNSVELGYYETNAVTCRPDCQWDVEACVTYCGDGVLNASELCEEGVPSTRSCIDYGYDRGALGCAACGPSVEDCGLIGWVRESVPGGGAGGVVAGGELFVVLADVGVSDLAAHYTNGSWVGLGSFPVASGEFPEPYAIAATGLSNIWVGGTTNAGTGDLGFVARYDGSTWTRVRTFPAVVSAMYAHSTHVFVMAGSDLFIYDGSAWTSQTLVTSATSFSISGSSETDVWIGGAKLWHGGAGQTFAEVTLPAAGTVSGVHAFGPDNVAVAIYQPGTNRLVLHVRENTAWRALPWTATGNKRGVPYVRASNDIFMLVVDQGAIGGLVAHHDGTSWLTLTEPMMELTGLVGSTGRDLVALDAQQLQAVRYHGMAWLAKAPWAGQLAYIAGAAPNALWATELSSLRNLRAWNGTTWQTSTQFGVVDALSETVMYAINPGVAVDNPQILEWSGTSWSEIQLPNTDEYAEWIGLHGVDDLFIKFYAGGANTGSLAQYFHWAGTGNSVIEATLETTNIPDGTELRYIDCRPAAGCYAAGPSGLWHTTGDRNAWAPMTGVDIGGYNALVMHAGSFVLLGGTLGRIARFDGSTWHVDTLPTSAPVVMLAVASATDAFALTRTSSSNEEHQLYHWDGVTWLRVRTPIPAYGAKVENLWTNGRITYLGGGTGSTVGAYFYSLVRTDPW